MDEKQEKVSDIRVMSAEMNEKKSVLHKDDEGQNGTGRNICPVYFFTMSRQIKRCGDR
jgi:hypothetical protein